MCGGSKETTSTQQQTQYTPTAEETALNRLLLQRTQATQGGMITAQQTGLDLINRLLTGGSLPGYLGVLAQGLNPETIAKTGTKMALNAMPGMQQLGIADSGEAAKAISQDITQNLLFPAEQFNIGNLQNLLNLALSGQAQVQQPIQAGTGILSSNLQGLRSINQTGSTTTVGMNPFLKSFQTSLGSGLGSVPGNIFSRFGQGTGMFGGGSF